MMLGVEWRILLGYAVLPPTGLVVLYFLGAALGWRAPRAGRRVCGAALILACILAMPAAGGAMLSTLEGAPLAPAAIADLARLDHAAIVVLSADFRVASEYGGRTVGGLTLERMRYGAFLHGATQLPVLVTGGVFEPSAAAMMGEAFLRDFAVPVRWREERSRTTAENARFSADLLRADGISTVVLVTHAWHMKRARLAFERAGMTVIPAPTGFAFEEPVELASFLPSAGGMRQSYFALHEWVGFAWYWLTLPR